MNKNLLYFLILLKENALLKKYNRKNFLFLNSILHNDFIEKVEDGSIWDKNKIIDYLLHDNANTLYKIISHEFEEYSSNKIVLKYKLHKIQDSKIKESNRRSIWILDSDTKWKMIYHEVS